MTAWMTVADVADDLAVSPRTVLRWIDRRDLPAYRLPGGQLRVRQADLAAMLEAGATVREGRGTLAAQPTHPEAN